MHSVERIFGHGTNVRFFNRVEIVMVPFIHYKLTTISCLSYTFIYFFGYFFATFYYNFFRRWQVSYSQNVRNWQDLSNKVTIIYDTVYYTIELYSALGTNRPNLIGAQTYLRVLQIATSNTVILKADSLFTNMGER